MITIAETYIPYGGYTEGVHLFPFRTEQLSPSWPMVLGHNPGRVGSRRLIKESSTFMLGIFFIYITFLGLGYI